MFQYRSTLSANMVEKIRGIKPGDWRKINAAPAARIFKIDIERKTPTISEVCSSLNARYAGNDFALAQIALFNTEDAVGQLHSGMMKEAIKGHDSAATTMNSQLRQMLVDRFPKLKILSETELQYLIDKNVYRLDPK